jgi:hypothetical protein
MAREGKSPLTHRCVSEVRATTHSRGGRSNVPAGARSETMRMLVHHPARVPGTLESLRLLAPSRVRVFEADY